MMEARISGGSKGGTTGSPLRLSPADQPGPRRAGPPLRVMILDAAPETMSLFSGEEIAGRFQPVYVSSASDLPEAMAGVDPDFFLVELRIPVVEKLNVIRLLRRSHPGAPVCAIVDEGREPLGLLCMRDGAGVLHRPLSPAALRAILDAGTRGARGGEDGARPHPDGLRLPAPARVRHF